MSPAIGRFYGMDSFAGTRFQPVTLNRFLYANGNPVIYTDPSGHFGLVDVMATVAIMSILAVASPQPVFASGGPDVTASLQITLDNISAEYHSWTLSEKWSAAIAIYDVRDWDTLINAWDIKELAEPGIDNNLNNNRSQTELTNGFRGKVYYNSSINYAMWGRINSLANSTFGVIANLLPGPDPWSLPTALACAAGFKLYQYWELWGNAQTQALAFTTYGYTGYFPPVSPLRGFKITGTPTTGPFEWKWLPVKPNYST